MGNQLDKKPQMILSLVITDKEAIREFHYNLTEFIEDTCSRLATTTKSSSHSNINTSAEEVMEDFVIENSTTKTIKIYKQVNMNYRALYSQLVSGIRCCHRGTTACTGKDNSRQEKIEISFYPSHHKISIKSTEVQDNDVGNKHAGGGGFLASIGNFLHVKSSVETLKVSMENLLHNGFHPKMVAEYDLKLNTQELYNLIKADLKKKLRG